MPRNQHQPKPRCSKCRWIHEADSVLRTSFQGVELCETHAALATFAIATLEILERDHEWNADTLDAIAEEAFDRSLADANGDEGRFRTSHQSPVTSHIA
jgi:hypothetical protein